MWEKEKEQMNGDQDLSELWVRAWNLNRTIRVGLVDKVTFEQSLGGGKGVSRADILGKVFQEDGSDSVKAVMWK